LAANRDNQMKRQLVLGLALSLFAGASCGGGGGGSNPPEPPDQTPPPTTEQMVWDEGNWDEVEWQ
jgi:hypothetical protein